MVGPRFYLDFPENTVALVVLSGPDVFEKCVIPYLKEKNQENVEFSTADPLDDSMKYTFTTITKVSHRRNRVDSWVALA